MVSKARLDLPEPESPVMTISLSRGISTLMFLRLWTRAPWTAMVVRAAALTTLELIGLFSQVNERQFLHDDIAHFGELNRSGGFGDQAAVGQILARGGHSFDIEVALEVGIDFGGRARLTHLAQVFEKGLE